MIPTLSPLVIAQQQSFQDFLFQQSAEIELLHVAINLCIAIVLALGLGQVYIRFGRSPSDRRSFASQFTLITLTTCLIIVVVKSSLALSLGLVGALSIVRFRSAVREHEELAFLFLCIAIGLCLGADQRGLALLGFGLVVGFHLLRALFQRRLRHENLFLRVKVPRDGDSDPVPVIAAILSKHCTMVKLKRSDMRNDAYETSFLVEFRRFEDLTLAQAALTEKLSPEILSVVDGQGLS